MESSKKTLVELLKETHDSLRFNEQGHAIIVMVRHDNEARKAYHSLRDYHVTETKGFLLVLEESAPKEARKKSIAERVQTQLAKISR